MKIDLRPRFFECVKEMLTNRLEGFIFLVILPTLAGMSNEHSTFKGIAIIFLIMFTFVYLIVRNSLD